MSLLKKNVALCVDNCQKKLTPNDKNEVLALRVSIAGVICHTCVHSCITNTQLTEGSNLQDCSAIVVVCLSKVPVSDAHLFTTWRVPVYLHITVRCSTVYEHISLISVTDSSVKTIPINTKSCD